MREAAIAALRAALALPLEEQREALLPLYRQAYAAYQVDWELNSIAMADDHVFEAGSANTVPGLPRRVVGRAGYIEAQERMLEDLDVARMELDELIPLGDSRVAVLTRFVIRAGDGEVDQQCIELHEFRDGEFVHQTFWFDRDEGRRAIGLPD